MSVFASILTLCPRSKVTKCQFAARIAAIAVLMVGITAKVSAAPSMPAFDKEFEELQKVVKNAPKYRSIAQNRADSLSRICEHIPSDDYQRLLRARLQLSKFTLYTDPELSLSYARDALEAAEKIGSTDAIVNSKIQLINVMADSGMFAEGVALYEELEKMYLTETQSIDLWECGMTLYGNMARSLPEGNAYGDLYREKNYCLADSLVTVLPRGEPYHRFLWAQKMYDSQRYADAREIMAKLKPEVVPGTTLYSVTWFTNAMLCKETGDMEGYGVSICKAAINDIKMWDVGKAALPQLITFLAEIGRTKEGYSLLAFYLENTRPENAQTMPYSLAMSLPTLEFAYSKDLQKSNTMSWVLFGISVALLIAFGLLLFKVASDRNRFRRMSDSLHHKARLQNSYMGNFIELCTVYAERLEDLRNLTMRKIQTGKSEEMLAMLKSGKVTEPQMEHFYSVFDKVFLEIYPDFIEKINLLLAPDKQYEISKDSGLTPELRIYALVRLGITEAQKISHILHYSPNTIYTYRNKLRNRAISRDTFDEDVMKITPELL